MTSSIPLESMKIVCLTEDSPGLRHTVNRLHARCGVALVVLESSKRRLFWKDLKRFGLAETLYRTYLVAQRLLGLGSAGSATAEILGSAKVPLDPTIPVLRCRDVNAPEVRAAIAKIAPKVLICQGTTLVRSETLAGVPYAFNIHAGLSPYYRGSRCTEWALALGDVANLGVTVHRLTSEIDGGGILGQARIALEEGDDVARINARIIAAGTEIVCGAVERLAQGVEPVFHPQPSGSGLHMRRRQWSRFLDKHVRSLLARGELPRMLKAPSAAPYPLVASWPPDPSPGLDTMEQEGKSPCRLLEKT